RGERPPSLERAVRGSIVDKRDYAASLRRADGHRVRPGGAAHRIPHWEAGWKLGGGSRLGKRTAAAGVLQSRAGWRRGLFHVHAEQRAVFLGRREDREDVVDIGAAPG